MSTVFSVGQMNQLGDALEAAGFTPEDVTKLRSSSLLPDIRSVLLGRAKIVVVKHVIDLDAPPFVPNGWDVELETHIKGGQFEWDPAKVSLYLSEDQQDGKTIQGCKLRKELSGKPVYNANLLDFLLAHPELIPNAWKREVVFFWGTLYRAGGRVYVRCLTWGGDKWEGSVYRVGNDFNAHNPVAVPHE